MALCCILHLLSSVIEGGPTSRRTHRLSRHWQNIALTFCLAPSRVIGFNHPSSLSSRCFSVCRYMTRGIKKSSRHVPLPVQAGAEGKLTLPHDAGSITYIRSFLGSDEAERLFNDTINAKSWARAPISFFGKTVLQPRDTAFFGTKLYSYSDERREPTPWDGDLPASKALEDLKAKIEEFLELPESWFNVVLANKYYDGQDYMGWHDDAEKSLGDEPIIASISLGAERRFLVRPKPSAQLGSAAHKIEYYLANGSLLVMQGSMQKYYQHSLPKVALSKCDQVRLNFTFRRVV